MSDTGSGDGGSNAVIDFEYLLWENGEVILWDDDEVILCGSGPVNG